MNQEHKIYQYADDTTLFLKPKESVSRKSMAVLIEFQLISGLKVNDEKTKVIKIGNWGDSRTTLCQEMKLEWTQKIEC